MGNILFVPSVPGSEWVATVLPGRSPAELPVTGRRLIDYALERMRRLGANFAEVLDWSFSERLSSRAALPRWRIHRSRLPARSSTA